MMRLKNRFSNHGLMARLNLSSDDVINWKETTFVKERYPQFGIEASLQQDSRTSLQQVKLLKLLQKYPKLEVVMSFNGAEI